MSINVILARELNWHKRAIKGAMGTTLPRFSNEATKDCSNVECLMLAGLIENAAEFKILLEKQEVIIDTIYLRFGSERARAMIIKRQEINAKLKAGRYEEVTDAEYQLLYRKH